MLIFTAFPARTGHAARSGLQTSSWSEEVGKGCPERDPGAGAAETIFPFKKDPTTTPYVYSIPAPAEERSGRLCVSHHGATGLSYVLAC